MNAVLAIIADGGRAINHVALFITSACSNQMYLNMISTLGDQWELKVGRLVFLEGLIEHSLDRSLEIVGDEILDQRLSGDLLGAVTNQSASPCVVDIDMAERINFKDGGVSRMDETRVFTFLGKMASDVLTVAHHANYISLLITLGGGVEQDI